MVKQVLTNGGQGSEGGQGGAGLTGGAGQGGAGQGSRGGDGEGGRGGRGSAGQGGPARQSDVNVILEVREVYKHFGGIAAIDNCSFRVQRGIITGLIGPNGAGKTTVFNVISGFYAPEGGEVYFNGTRITHLHAHKRAGLGIARTFQSMRLFPKMTVMENLLAASYKVNEGLHSAIFNWDLLRRRRHPDEKRAEELLALVGLSHMADELAENLSYGQQKLTEIIRAMVAAPDLLLLDEPAAGVNPSILKSIVDLVQDFKRQGGTVLLIEHNMRLVMSICDHVIVLDYGKHLAEGPPSFIQNHPEVIEAYLGKRKEKAAKPHQPKPHQPKPHQPKRK